MSHLSLALLIAGATLVGTAAGADPALPVERIIRIDVPNHDAAYSLRRQVDLAIIDTRDRSVIAYADDGKIEHLRSLGYPVTVLVEDYVKQAEQDLVTYYSYAQVCSVMTGLAAQYPAITKLETLGISMGGRAILIMKVTSDPTREANKPRIRLNGPHHGNEKIATEITLAFMQYLCAQYDSSPSVRALVDTREFWIMPIFNVDGHVANRRTNNNGIDLNRDYGYEWDGEGGSPSPFSQVETRSMRRHAEDHVIDLEFSYHSTAAYVNYLWDNHPADPPDSSWVIALSRRYADSTYGSGTQLTPINGYAWYEVHGSCQDNTFGVYGALAWTIETALPSTRPAIDAICVANRRALLDMTLIAGWGIEGIVTDSASGQPLFARVEFVNPERWFTYTQPEVGDFHKMLPPGTYTVRVSSNGYVSRTIPDVVVPDTGAVSLAVPLKPDSLGLCHVQKLVWVRRPDNSHVYRDWFYRALGAPDGVNYALGPAGTIVFDVDPNCPVRNEPGNDITVHALGSYSLAAANDWEGPWFSLGPGGGTASFDLSAVALDSARYLKLVDAGSAVIDAVSYVGHIGAGIEQSPLNRTITRFDIMPNPTRDRAQVRLGSTPGTRFSVAILDATGRAIRSLAQDIRPGPGFRLVWDLRTDAGLPAPSGVYFCRAASAAGSLVHKVIVER